MKKVLALLMVLTLTLGNIFNIVLINAKTTKTEVITIKVEGEDVKYNLTDYPDFTKVEYSHNGITYIIINDKKTEITTLNGKVIMEPIKTTDDNSMELLARKSKNKYLPPKTPKGYRLMSKVSGNFKANTIGMLTFIGGLLSKLGMASGTFAVGSITTLFSTASPEIYFTKYMYRGPKANHSNNVYKWKVITDFFSDASHTKLTARMEGR